MMNRAEKDNYERHNQNRTYGSHQHGQNQLTHNPPIFLKEAQGSKISTGGITTIRIPQKEKGDGSQSRHYQSDSDYG